ncbi:MAG: ATP-binding protein [Verrucomicrobia bacterium]|nr:ATP-binding protein [Verrucomicrobiota bacterium]
MISRPVLTELLSLSVAESRITALLGPRQCGKTTLAQGLYHQEKNAGRQATWFDCENPRDAARLANPLLTLETLNGTVFIDEFQRIPQLSDILRVLSDRQPMPAKFVILGSASPALVRHSAESLAGRVRFIDMAGLTVEETGTAQATTLWLRGGYPESYLAASEAVSMTWRENFIRTFLERDVPQLGYRIPAERLRRFLSMCAHYHGQTWNGSAIASSLGMSPMMMNDYLDLYTGAFVMRRLQAWHANLGKRQVKAPKIYLRDSGLAHAILGIPDLATLQGHPKLGASWEGFALEQILARTGDRHAYFWGTHGGAELDLVLEAKGKLWGVEFKYADAPRLTPSMRSALSDLELERIWVIHPGVDNYPLAERVDVLGLASLATLIDAVQ